MPARSRQRELSPREFRSFLEKLKRGQIKKQALFGSARTSKARLSSRELVVLKRDSLFEAANLHAFAEAWKWHAGTKPFAQSQYEIEFYKPIAKERQERCVDLFPYFLRPSVANLVSNIRTGKINMPSKKAEIEKKHPDANHQRLSALYSKRLVEKSGLSAEEFEKRLLSSWDEFYSDTHNLVREFKLHIKLYKVNVLVKSFDKETGKFTFVLIDP